MDASGAGTEGLLSQSYAQGLERISQHNDNIGFFQLPQEIIDEREKTWDSFFEKYSRTFTDEIEINLRSPSDDEEEEADDGEEDGKEDDDDEDEEEESYYIKDKSPMRKNKWMVQHWVDTGEPPYRLLDENNRSDSGSSLSEGLSPKVPLQSVTKQVQVKRSGTSNCSSVDTAAYILSNTNITKKAETMAIVEGSKSPQNGATTAAKPRSPSEPNRSAQEDAVSNDNALTVKSVQNSQDPCNISNNVERAILEKPFDSTRQNAKVSEPKESEMEDMPRSIKLTDILPTLENWDKLMAKSALHQLRRDSENVSGNSSGTSTPKPSINVRKLQKKKLYTGRDSPMASILSPQPIRKRSIENKVENNNAGFHMTSMPRKRLNLKDMISLITSKPDALCLVPHNNKDSSESQTDGKSKNFFKSLGLFPSPRFNTKTKRKTLSVTAQRIRRKRQTKKSIQKPNSGDDSDNGKSSEMSPATNKSMDHLLSLCTKKTLSVPLERLSETVLMRLKTGNKVKRKVLRKRRKKRVKSITASIDEKCQEKDSENSSESQKMVDFKEKTKVPSKLEEIELDSQESDGSTIIMCKAPSDVIESSSTQTTSRTSSVGSENSEVTVRIRHSKVDAGKNNENVENKAVNPVIRRLRRRSIFMEKQEEEEEKQRKTKKVNAKKIIVKNVNSTNNKILETVDNYMTRYSKDKVEMTSDDKLPIATDKKKECKIENKDEMKKIENVKEDEMEEDYEIDTRRTTTVCTMRFTSDSDSRSECSSKPPKPRLVIKRQSSNPVITFSSDDEDDLVTAMEKKVEQYERKHRSSRSSKISNSIENQKNIIDTFIGEPVALLLRTIAESEDEEIIQLTKPQAKLKTKKNPTKTENSRKSARKSAVEKSAEKKSSPKPTKISERLSVVRTLSFDDNSSKKSEEIIKSPPKKLKLQNGDVHQQKQPRLTETVNSNESANESTKNLLDKSTRSGRAKRKADLEENSDIITEVNRSPVTRSQSPTKLSVFASKQQQKQFQSPSRNSKKSINKSPTKIQLHSKTPIKSTKKDIKPLELKELQVSIEKISDVDLEKSLSSRSKISLSSVKKYTSPPKKMSIPKKHSRPAQKRSLLSDGESSEADFILQLPDNNAALINDQSTSDIDSTKCTELFHDPYEETGKELDKLLTRSNRKNKKQIRIENKNIKPIRTFRTRIDSDSDD